MKHQGKIRFLQCASRSSEVGSFNFYRQFSYIVGGLKKQSGTCDCSDHLSPPGAIVTKTLKIPST